MAIDHAKVTDLLAQAKVAHQAALIARNQRVPDRVEAEAQLRRAYELRTEADALDPEHTARAWSGGGGPEPTHEQLMAFYRDKLNIERGW